MRILGAYVLLNLFYQIYDTLECAAADRLLGDLVEPNFDLVEPRGVRPYLVHMPGRTKRQPALDRRMLVGGVLSTITWMSSVRGPFSSTRLMKPRYPW
jgi:hypothetical protein